MWKVFALGDGVYSKFVVARTKEEAATIWSGEYKSPKVLYDLELLKGSRGAKLQRYLDALEAFEKVDQGGFLLPLLNCVAERVLEARRIGQAGP